MLTTKLILERLDKEGRILERREQLSRSFLLQFIDFLYMQHTQANHDIRDITNVLRTLDYDANRNQQLTVASLPGHAGDGITSALPYVYTVEGQDVGIQVGRGDTAVTPTDYKMEDRIEHGRCGDAGAKADFLNPSFETGDLTSWTEAHSGNMVGTVDNGIWALKDGTWYCTLLSTGAVDLGDYAEVSQDIDLTNISHLRFQLRGESFASHFWFLVLVDGHPVYKKVLEDETDYPNELAAVCAYTGVHTVTFRCTAKESYATAARGTWVDNIETVQITELEYGGTEIVGMSFSNPNGQFTIRRYFTNSSGSSVTVNEVGIQAMGQIVDVYPFLIARDVVSPGVEVAAGQILRATYVPSITV